MAATARLDAAIAAISDPQRLANAQDLVARRCPACSRCFASALADGGWFDTAQSAALREAVVDRRSRSERLRMIESLIAEETRLSMLVGVDDRPRARPRVRLRTSTLNLTEKED